MKQIITRVLKSPLVKKVLEFLKQNRRVVLVFLIGIIFVDIFFVKIVSDIITFGVLLLYGISVKTYHLKARKTFLLCLGLLGAMFMSYLVSRASIPTEKAAVWLVLFMALGVYQQWREISGSEEKENYSSQKSSTLKNILLLILKRASSSFYSIFGPVVSFKLAMSPLGKALFWIVTQKKKTITLKTKYDFLLNVSSYEYLMSGYFFMGETNPYETNVLRKTLKEGDVFFDIGAHIGWYSLNAAQIVGRKGRVIAFEPNPSCFADVETNRNLNKFENILVEPIAVSDKNARFDFWTGDNMGGSLIENNTKRLTIGKRVKKIKVSAQTLDSYCKEHNIKEINLIKIDVEGAEMQVLRGAKLTLKNFSPDIVIEWVDITFQASNTSKQDLITFFSAYGYQPYTFTSNGLKPYFLGQIQETINVYFSKKIFR